MGTWKGFYHTMSRTLFLIGPDVTTGPYGMDFALWNAHPLGGASAL